MFRSLFVRRLVTGVSVVMLLLCQTAAATLAYAAAPLPLAAQATAVDAAPPCHDAARSVDDVAPDHGCQDRCPSRFSSIETAKINLPAADNLVLTVFPVAPASTTATVTAPHEQIIACAAPPPLRLLYCRMLN
jgi:hypothetical protein